MSEGRPKYATRRDENQAGIVVALRHLGFIALDVSQLAPLGFDLLVCGYHGAHHLPMWLAVEVKTEDGELTERESEFQAEMVYKFDQEAPVLVARGVTDILDWYSRIGS